MNAGAYAFFIKGVDRMEFLARIKAAADSTTSFPTHGYCGSFSEVVFRLIIVLTIVLAAGLTTGSA